MVASDVGVGDVETPWVDVAPADGTTSAALTVTAPDGATTFIAATGGDLVEIADTSPTEYFQRWTTDTPVVYGQAGRWVLSWEVTGTGEGAEDLEVYVVASPVAGGPTWTPGRSRVANYLPHRTLIRSTSSTIGSQDEYLFSWDSTTVPTGIQVDRLIADGVAWVSALVTPMNTSSEALGSLVASLWCAIAIERSWPDDDSSLERARDMEKRLDTMLAQLIASNGLANGNDGTGTGEYGLDAVWQFPPADCRWDSPTYW